MTSPPSPAPAPDDPWYGVDAAAFELSRLPDPYPLFHAMRARAPVHTTPIGVVRLARHADCVRLLRETRCGVRRRDGTIPRPPSGVPAAELENSFMLEQDPPKHTRLRKLVAKAFTPRAVEAWRPRARALAQELVDRAIDAGEADLVAGLALPVPATLICEMLGVPIADRDRFTTWTADATHGLAGDLAAPSVRARAMAGGMALAGYIAQRVEERRKDRADDILSELIRAEEEGERLSAVELITQAVGLLIAGFETTIGLIGNGAVALARHPDEAAKLRARPELVPNAVEECLRWDGPIAITARVLHEAAEFGGIGFAPDTEIWSMLWAANRDPERFPDPDRFDVERPNAREHLAFGGGTHLCLGAHLARMEAQEALGALVARSRSRELACDEIAWGASLFRVPGKLPMRVRR
jgi:cytochrome P450